MLGLLKGFVGLSGAIFTQLYRATYGVNDDSASLVLLMAWLPAAISLLFIPTIRIMPRNTADAGPAGRERKAFFYFLYASIVLAVYLLVMNVVELEVLRFPKTAYYVTATVLLLLIFFTIFVATILIIIIFIITPSFTIRLRVIIIFVILTPFISRGILLSIVIITTFIILIVIIVVVVIIIII